MILEGARLLADVAAEQTPEAKAVFNEHGIIVGLLDDLLVQLRLSESGGAP